MTYTVNQLSNGPEGNIPISQATIVNLNAKITLQEPAKMTDKPSNGDVFLPLIYNQSMVSLFVQIRYTLTMF